MHQILATVQSAMPGDVAQAIGTIVVAILSWCVSRKKTQAKEREKR